MDVLICPFIPGLCDMDFKALVESETPLDKKERALFTWLFETEKELLQGKLPPTNLQETLLECATSTAVKPNRLLRDLYSRVFVLVFSVGGVRTLFDTIASIQQLLANKKTDDILVKWCVKVFCT